MKRATANYIVANDPNAADDIIGHNEYGERTGCWKPPSRTKTKN